MVHIFISKYIFGNETTYFYANTMQTLIKRKTGMPVLISYKILYFLIFIYLTASSISCRTQDLHYGMQDLSL